MILNDVNGAAIRVSDIRNMHKIMGTSSSALRYSIDIKFKHSTGNTIYRYGEDQDARDADFEKINRAMDALDGIQQ